jgi:hypothetical protein
LDGPNAASTFRLKGRGFDVPLGGEATSSPWLVLAAHTYDVIIRCTRELACRIELDDGNGNGRVLALAGSPGRTLVQVWHHCYISNREQPMVWMPAGSEEQVIDLAGEIQGDAGQSDSTAVRLITIKQSAYPSR